MKRITSVSLLALALAGCVNMAPDHTRPALASAAAYDPAFAPDGTVTAATLSYGDWFTDPGWSRSSTPPLPTTAI